ncbi:hypothetical protein ACXNSR_31710 [Streptomyces sp. NC-S4]
MTEWIDPRYVELVAELRDRQEGPDRQGLQPVRGFIVPDPDES